MSPLLAFLNSPQDWLLLAVIAVVLFGIKRLPEAGRSLGKGINEFKKGLKGIEDDVTDTSAAHRNEPAGELPRPPQRITPAAPRFEETPADKPNTPS